MKSFEKRIQIQKGIGHIVHEQGAVCRKERERCAGDSGKNQVHNKAPTPTKVSAASKTRVFHEVQYMYYVKIAIKFILDFAMMFTKKRQRIF